MITLIICAATVAYAAPFAPIPYTATRIRSPAILQMHAINTVMRGVLESPRPLKILPIRLYAMITIEPRPHILTYAVVRSNAASGACMRPASCGAKIGIIAVRNAPIARKSSMPLPTI